MKDPVLYDAWYDEHPCVFESELRALRLSAKDCFNESGKIKGEGLDAGGGTGRFALELGIKTVLDPSVPMGKIASGRGLLYVQGSAESMPFPDAVYDVVLFVTSLCFIEDIDRAFKETCRVLKQNGNIIIGMINSDSAEGKKYISSGETVRRAKHHSPRKVIKLLKQNNFSEFNILQTIFQNPLEMKMNSEIRTGFDEGVFVVVRAKKNTSR